MRQVLVRGRDDVAVVEVDPAPLAASGVRIDVAYAGICGSELHSIHDPGRYGAIRPDGFGHEYSGVVREVGADVRGVAPGQRVTCVPRLPCMRCAACRDGRLVNCRDHVRPAQGAWAEEVVVDERFVRALPPGLGLREAALCEPLSCALRGVDRGGAAPGHVALVIGGGPIGLLTAAVALHAGAHAVLVSEPRAARRALAERLGASVVDPTTESLADAVAQATAGQGVAVAYEAVGRADSIVEAVELTAVGGTIVVLGLAPAEAVAPIRPERLFEKELTIAAAWAHETTFERALAWLPRLDLGALVTHELGLDRVAEAIEISSAGDCGKVMLVPNGA